MWLLSGRAVWAEWSAIQPEAEGWWHANPRGMCACVTACIVLLLPLLLLLQVTASVPWPMTGTVEAIMVDQAKKTVGQYVEYIGKYVEAALEDANNNLRRGQEESAGVGTSFWAAAGWLWFCQPDAFGARWPAPLLVTLCCVGAGQAHRAVLAWWHPSRNAHA